jgi:hypothetical protein
MNKNKKPRVGLPIRKRFQFKLFSVGSVILSLFLAIGFVQIVIRSKSWHFSSNYTLFHIFLTVFFALYSLIGVVWIFRKQK